MSPVSSSGDLATFDGDNSALHLSLHRQRFRGDRNSGNTMQEHHPLQLTGLTEALQARRKLRTAEAAEYTTISESTLTKLRLVGGGPTFIKVGKSVLYDVTDLDAWLASHRRRSTSSNAEAA